MKNFILALLLISSFWAYSQPANDNCHSATPIPVGGCLAGTVLNATQSLDGCQGTADDDVWFQFTASSAEMSIEVDPSDSFDPVLQIFSSCGGTSLRCVDTYHSGGTETATFNNLITGNTYYVRVYHYSISKPATSDFDICVVSLADPPDNDDCTSAINLTSGTTLSTSVANATESQPACAGTADDDVWYSFSASSSVHYLNLYNNSFDAVLQVFGGCNGTSLACVDKGGEENIKLSDLTVGETYYARVYSFSSSPAISPEFDILLSDEVSATLDVVPDTFCSGQEADISFTTSGTINSQNEFSIYLSDTAGNFETETLIGSGLSSPVQVTFPTTIAAGSEYKIRIKSSIPSETHDSSAAFTITRSPIELDYNGSNIIVSVPQDDSPYLFRINNNDWQSSSSLDVPDLNIRHTAYFQDSKGCISSATVKITSDGSCETGYEKDGLTDFEFRPFSPGTQSGNFTVTYDAGGVPDQIEVWKNGTKTAGSGGQVSHQGFFNFPHDASTATDLIIKIFSPVPNSTAAYSLSCPLSASAVTMTTGTVTTCGETFISPGLGSTGYPASQTLVRTYYPDGANSAILARIKLLQLAEEDTLFVYNGTSPSGTPAAVYTGLTISNQATLLATNNFGALTFVFSTNSADSLAGFKTEVSCVTNGLQMQNTSSWVCEGFLVSPNHPQTYPANSSITHTLYPATNGEFLRIDFENLDLDAGDYLYIYNGRSIHDPLIGVYSDTMTAFSKIAYNTSGALTLRLLTNGISDGESGFFARLSCSEVPETMAGGSVVMCDKLYASPGFPNNYGNGEAITETLYPLHSNGKVSINFDFLLLESFDRLYIYDGTSTSAPMIGSYSGSTSPGTVTATNSSGALTLHFQSDNSIDKPGWLAEVSCIYPMGNNSNLERQINIYPVPADNYLMITSPESVYGFQVVNMLGEEIMKGNLSNSLELPTSGIPEGIYLINLFYPEGTITRKFIIAR